MVQRVLKGLVQKMEERGLQNIGEAIGLDSRDVENAGNLSD